MTVPTKKPFIGAILLLVLLLGEQKIDQQGGADDDGNDGEDDHHAHAHVLQVLHEGHGIKLQAQRGVCQEIHIINLP